MYLIIGIFPPIFLMLSDLSLLGWTMFEVGSPFLGGSKISNFKKKIRPRRYFWYDDFENDEFESDKFTLRLSICHFQTCHTKNTQP